MKDAITFYKEKTEDLGKNLTDLEKVVQGKGGNLKVIEEGKARSGKTYVWPADLPQSCGRK